MDFSMVFCSSTLHGSAYNKMHGDAGGLRGFYKTKGAIMYNHSRQAHSIKVTTVKHLLQKVLYGEVF